MRLAPGAWCDSQCAASRLPGYRVADSTTPSRDKAAPRLSCLRSPPSLLPRRRRATAPASGKAARRLAACRRLPYRVLNRARGCATGFVAPAIAVSPAPTFWPWLALFHFPAAREIKTVPPTALRIHSAATRPNTRPRPTSFLLHSAGRTRPRQTRCAGLPVNIRVSAHRAIVTQPGRGKFAAARRALT